MKIPKSHFGTVRDVTKNATAIARAVAAGTSWNAAVGEEFFDTDTVDGLILVGTDDSAFAKQPGFLIGLVLETVWLRVTARAAKNGQPGDAERADERLFNEALTTDWGVLALLCGTNFSFLERDGRRVHPLFEAALRHWPTYEAVGRRFTTSGLTSDVIWQVPNGMHHMLSSLGVPEKEVDLDRTTGPTELLRFLRND